MSWKSASYFVTFRIILRQSKNLRMNFSARLQVSWPCPLVMKHSNPHSRRSLGNPSSFTPPCASLFSAKLDKCFETCQEILSVPQNVICQDREIADRERRVDWYDRMLRTGFRATWNCFGFQRPKCGSLAAYVLAYLILLWKSIDIDSNRRRLPYCPGILSTNSSTLLLPLYYRQTDRWNARHSTQGNIIHQIGGPHRDRSKSQHSGRSWETSISVRRYRNKRHRIVEWSLPDLFKVWWIVQCVAWFAVLGVPVWKMEGLGKDVDTEMHLWRVVDQQRWRWIVIVFVSNTK